MVRGQITARSITDARVLAALGRVPRHGFVPVLPTHAYGNGPLPIGQGQTMTQPRLVAFKMVRSLPNVQPLG
jgi:protein-L-isoaspartate(D-aspartate) O-methyltransferase